MRTCWQHVLWKGLREVVRQQSCRRCLVGTDRELRKHPTQVGFLVDVQHFAGAQDGIQHRGAPARFGVTDCEPILSSQFCGPEHVLDLILIDVDMAVANFGVGGQMPPPVVSIGRRILESALERSNFLKALWMRFEIGLACKCR
jgi:hypothetical protein